MLPSRTLTRPMQPSRTPTRPMQPYRKQACYGASCPAPSSEAAVQGVRALGSPFIPKTAPWLSISQPFVFIHIQKTGGTTFRRMAANELYNNDPRFLKPHVTTLRTLGFFSNRLLMLQARRFSPRRRLDGPDARLRALQGPHLHVSLTRSCTPHNPRIHLFVTSASTG